MQYLFLSIVTATAASLYFYSPQYFTNYVMHLENTSRIGPFLAPPLNLDPNYDFFPGLKQDS